MIQINADEVGRHASIVMDGSTVTSGTSETDATSESSPISTPCVCKHVIFFPLYRTNSNHSALLLQDLQKKWYLIQRIFPIKVQYI